jgi:DNA-directed RNA polymerase subunit alpha
MLWELGVQGWPPFNRAFLEMVEDLTLSIRSANCLKNDNILYVGDLVQKSQTEILQIPNMGRVGLNEIRLALAGLGLDLGMEIPGWPPNNIESLAEGLTKHFEDA